MKQNKLFHIIIASGFGSGFSPFAPGTAGAILATILWLLFAFLIPAYVFLITIVLIVVFALLGIWSANVLESTWGKDPSRVVVDEMVGVWIPLLAVTPNNLIYVIPAFVLFRIFDIFKPLGIRKMESLNGGLGVMMDDVLAGIYSLIVLLTLQWVVG